MNNIMIRRLVYALKQQWGREITYIEILSSEVNDSTGDRVIKRAVHTVNAVIMPQSTFRKFVQDIGYLAANKNFTYGALNDLNKLAVLFDAYELPEATKANLNGYIIHNGKRYDRQSIEDFFDEAFMMICQGVEGAHPFSCLTLRVESRLKIGGQVELS